MIEKLELSCREAHSLTERVDSEFHRSVPGISAWSVAQHLDHLARAQRGCVAAAEHILARKPGTDLEGRPTEQGLEILRSGRIPRGMGEAPERARPAEQPDRNEIRRLLQDAQRGAAAIEARAAELPRATGRVSHHDLGPFSALEWLRFAEIHNRHHLAIIAELLEERAR
jgi:hypothetical protein